MPDFESKIKNDLNPEQHRAVETLTGPVLVLAGAGSGKTRVIAYRTANLIYTNTARPYEILAVTFTNKAADEMRGRVHSLVGADGHQVALGTFHRSCAQILRRFGQEIGIPTEFQILDDTESTVLVKRCMKNMGIDVKHYDPKGVAGTISGAKGNLIDWKKFQEAAMSRWEQLVGEVYESYQKALEHNKSLDFDDLIMKTVELMEQSPRTLDHLQNRYKYLLIDEYQDVNRAQYVFAKTLAQRDKNICVVGDDDQSIYAFRGADPKYILNFEQDFPGAAVIKLEQNYRSTSKILNAANEIVKKNPKRHYKNLWTSRGDGELISFKYTRSDEDEAIYIAETIEALGKAYDLGYSSFAVLYRTNALSRVFEETFTKYSIPYQIIGGFRFYERKEIKDVLAYLKLVQNPWDTVSLQRIINTPTRGIGDKSFTRLLQVLTEYNLGVHQIADREEMWGLLGGYAAPRIVSFCGMIRSLHEEKDTYSVFELTGRILDETGYVKKLEDSETVEAESRLENIDELMGAISRFDEAYPTEGLPVFLEQVALVQATDELDPDAESVKCLTAHSAKGLEFPVVFLAGLEDGLFPHSRAKSAFEIEEERRLFYVSVTRAMDRLFMSSAFYRSSSAWRNAQGFGGSLPSRFLTEIPDGLIEPADPESRSALIGDFSIETRVDVETKDIVESEYTEMGDGWNVLPRAYEWAKESGMISSGEQYQRKTRVKKSADDLRMNIGPSAYKVGDTVKHPTFGTGKITKIQPAGGDYFLQIYFETEGSKLLSELKAPLEKIETVE
ncbi:MAG TPA: ATP-dependent DNA helicase PcrA [Firmicutes bacterium]|nr:ATP-dependent DNA helicase PcrA [Bacillota bacterium]